LQNGEELDDYTYRVAGCVGEFWTKMCAAHLWPARRLDGESLTRQGVRFGKGLQLVNILRDLPQDLRKGRCYVPSPSLTAAGLAPKDLFPRKTKRASAPFTTSFWPLAEGHLAAGWEYTGIRCPKGRCGCGWPAPGRC
jgi:farnesyl-diphosphate farnesyltransferase